MTALFSLLSLGFLGDVGIVLGDSGLVFSPRISVTVSLLVVPTAQSGKPTHDELHHYYPFNLYETKQNPKNVFLLGTQFTFHCSNTYDSMLLKVHVTVLTNSKLCMLMNQSPVGKL